MLVEKNLALQQNEPEKCSGWLCYNAFKTEFAAAREVGRTFHGYHRCSVDKLNCRAKIRHSKWRRSALGVT